MYDTDTFVQEGSGGDFQSPAFTMPQAFQSFQASDLSKKLGNLSILNLKGKVSSRYGQEEEDEQDTQKLATMRAEKTLKLLDNLTLNTFTPNDENDIMNKISLITEKSSGYDSSLRKALNQLEDKIQAELHHLDSSDGDDNDNAKLYLNNLTDNGPLGDVSRFHLRNLVEEDLIKEQSTSLRKFQKVINSINSMKDDIAQIIDQTNELQSKVQTSAESNKSIKNQISELNNERKLINMKKELLLAFKATFTLNQYEEHILKFGNLKDQQTAIDFFNAIERVKQIQSKCDILLSIDNENLGLNVMTNMNNILNFVSDKILHYVQRNIETMYSANDISKSNVDSEVFQRAFIYIWENDNDAFDSVVSNLVSTRSKIVLNDFMKQLNIYSNEVSGLSSFGEQNINSNNSKLFLSSYDTNKFISDTLAYVHSIIINEMEGTRSLLTFDFTKEISLKESELNELISRVVQSIVSCLCKPVKSSIENSIRQEAKLTTLSNSSGVLNLYESMYAKLVPKLENPIVTENEDQVKAPTPPSLLDTLSLLENEIQEKAFSLINLRLKQIQAEFSESNQIEENTILPDWIVDWCQFIDELFLNKDSSGRRYILGFSDNQWDQFLNLLISSPLSVINDYVKKFRGEARESLIIWQINCIDYIFGRISVISELSEKSTEVETLLEEKVEKLTKNEFNKLLTKSGLFDIFNLINMIFEIDEEFFDVMYYQPIVENKMFNLETFTKANLKLSEFLNNYINDNTLTRLMSPSIFNTVFEGSSVKFVHFYGKVLAITNEYLKDPVSDEPYKIFKWDERSVATLLGVDEFGSSQ